jgi:DNA-binding GntR family transcriptional regulator
MPPAKKRASSNSSAGAPPDTGTQRPNPYDRIREAILTGEFEPGRPLVELALAEWCGVSRTPIREALLRLEQDGLIRRDAQGLKVRVRTPEEMLDLYATRTVMEVFASRVAADRRTDHDLLLLRWHQTRCREMLDSDVHGMTRENRQFHQALWRATHNESLIDVIERLQVQLGPSPTTTVYSAERWVQSLAEHDELIEAIERRDADAAAEITQRHIEAARDIRLMLAAAQGPLA